MSKKVLLSRASMIFGKLEYFFKIFNAICYIVKVLRTQMFIQFETLEKWKRHARSTKCTAYSKAQSSFQWLLLSWLRLVYIALQANKQVFAAVIY